MSGPGQADEPGEQRFADEGEVTREQEHRARSLHRVGPGDERGERAPAGRVLVDPGERRVPGPDLDHRVADALQQPGGPVRERLAVAPAASAFGVPMRELAPPVSSNPGIGTEGSGRGGGAELVGHDLPRAGATLEAHLVVDDAAVAQGQAGHDGRGVAAPRLGLGDRLLDEVPEPGPVRVRGPLRGDEVRAW